MVFSVTIVNISCVLWVCCASLPLAQHPYPRLLVWFWNKETNKNLVAKGWCKLTDTSGMEEETVQFYFEHSSVLFFHEYVCYTSMWIIVRIIKSKEIFRKDLCLKTGMFGLKPPCMIATLYIFLIMQIQLLYSQCNDNPYSCTNKVC